MAKVKYKNKETGEELTLEIETEKEAMSIFASLIVRHERQATMIVQDEEQLKKIMEDLDFGTTRN